MPRNHRAWRTARARRLCFILLALSGVSGLSAAAPPDPQKIEALVAAYSAARESRDATAIDQLFTEDADQLPSSGVWRRGKATLVKGMLESSSNNPGRRTLTVETIRFVTPTVAIADARYVIEGRPGSEPRRMWSTFVARKTDNGWRICAIRNMLPRPR